MFNLIALLKKHWQVLFYLVPAVAVLVGWPARSERLNTPAAVVKEAPAGSRVDIALPFSGRLTTPTAETANENRPGDADTKPSPAAPNAPVDTAPIETAPPYVAPLETDPPYVAPVDTDPPYVEPAPTDPPYVEPDPPSSGLLYEGYPANYIVAYIEGFVDSDGYLGIRTGFPSYDAADAWASERIFEYGAEGYVGWMYSDSNLLNDGSYGVWLSWYK